ncbi:MAG: alpha/beta hydrolase family protein [Limisphaerales bacterium]
MNRRDFLKAAPGVLGAGTLLSTPWAVRAATAPETRAARVGGRVDRNLTIRDYLNREARQITDRALADFGSAGAWRRGVGEKRRQFLEMLALDELPVAGRREPPPVHVTGMVERPAYRIEKLHFESLPGVHITANLYVPAGLTGPAPGVVYVCGHAQRQKVHYQAHPRRFAELGFVCLLVETVQLGEVTGHHHGCYREGWFHWYSRGYSSAAIETWNGIRALDLLEHRPEVDGTRLGVTGISGGGATSWWLAAADERIKVAAPVCGTATLASHVADRTIDGHCDCMWWVNTRRWDLADVGALIAPRPLLIASADRDGIFTIESIRQVHAQLARLYRRLGASEQLRLVETPGGHSYHERSRTGIFSWFIRHLQDRQVAPEAVGDIDDSPARQETFETLRVYGDRPPEDNRVATVQDDWPKPAEVPSVPDAAALRQERERVRAGLRLTAFGAFPGKPPALEPRVEYDFEDGQTSGFVFSFASEAGWRLRGQVRRPTGLSGSAPVIVGLRLPGEERNATSSFLGRIRLSGFKLELATRGTADTAWGEELHWHVRRAAAWTGRTVASMRVWDTLRAIEAIRALPELEATGISLAARGEMGAVALYAALLDGQLERVLLSAPPATQNVASQPDGRGPAIEMLGCLRLTDLPQVAGLLWPTELVIAGVGAEAYAWSESLYQRLGAPGRFTRVADLDSWRPA